MYWCEDEYETDVCPKDKTFIYLMSNHENIDHAEYMALEHIVRSVCIDPKDLIRLSTHEKCVHDAAMAGMPLYDVKKGCSWEGFKGIKVDPNHADGVVVHGVETYGEVPIKSQTQTVRKGPGDNQFTGNAKQTWETGECQEIEMVVTVVEGSESNEMKIKYDLIEREDSSWLAYWDPLYQISVVCQGGVCERQNELAVVQSRFRIFDPAALFEKVHQLMADHCVDPNWAKALDMQSSCGKEMDPNTCLLSDIKNNAPEYKADLYNGVWYIVAGTDRSFPGGKVKVEDGDSPTTKKWTVYFQEKSGKCVGPMTVNTYHETAHDVFKVQLVAGPMKTMYPDEWVMVHLCPDFMVTLVCGRVNADGTCMVHETGFTVLSRKPSSAPGDLPDNLKDMVKKSCVSAPLNHYTISEDCKNKQA